MNSDQRDPVPDLAFQLLAAANYIDALGGVSTSYRAAIAAHETEQIQAPAEAHGGDRREFEAHASERGFDLARYPDPGSCYVSFDTDKHWQTWRAAMASKPQPKGMHTMVKALQAARDDLQVAGFDATVSLIDEALSTQAPAPAPEKPLPAELGEWLTAIGELYIAMGRPKFEATEPTLGVVETLREAAKRLAAASPAVGAESAAAEGPTFYLVLAPNGLEGVAFADQADARYAATGRQSGFGVSTIADAFRDAYEDADNFETLEVRAASHVPVHWSGQ